MLLASYVAVVFDRRLEEFIAAVFKLLAMSAKLLDLFFGKRLEIAQDLQVLVEDTHGIHAADSGGNSRQAHGITEGFGGSQRSVHDHFTGTSHTLHSEDGQSAFGSYGQDMLLKAPIAIVEWVQGHLHRIEGKPSTEHREMN